MSTSNQPRHEQTPVGDEIFRGKETQKNEDISIMEGRRQNIMKRHLTDSDVSDEELLHAVDQYEQQQRDLKKIKIRCDQCDMEFKTRSGLHRHEQTHNEMQKCELCGKTYTRKESLKYHKRKQHGQVPTKRSLSCDICNKSFRRPYLLSRHQAKAHGPELNVLCRHCDCRFENLTDLCAHVAEHHPLNQRGEQRDANQLNQRGGEIQRNQPNESDTSERENRDEAAAEVGSRANSGTTRRTVDRRALQNGIENRIIYPEQQEGYDVLTFLADVKTDVRNFLQSRVEGDNGIKWSVLIQVEMEKDSGEGNVTVSTPFFRSSTYILLNRDTFSEHDLNEALQKLHANMEKYLRDGSGWYVKKVLKLEIHTVIYKPLSGSSYITLPKTLALSQCILNIENEDDKCFLYCLLASVHQVDTHPKRVESYLPFIDDIDMSNVSYPVSLGDIEKIERQNPSISVNVFGYENEEIIPLKITSHSGRLHHVNLLYLVQDKRAHYCLIQNLNRFLSRMNSHNSQLYYCPYCLHGFRRESLLQDHISHCRLNSPQKINLPIEGKDNVLKFTDYEKTLPVPFVIYADFETLNVKLTSCDPCPDQTNTTQTHKLEVCGFGYKVVCADSRYTKSTVVYRGSDASEKLIIALLEEMKNIKEILSQVEPMVLTNENLKEVENPVSCCICEERFSHYYLQYKYAVKHHSHLTGEFIGMAHNHCNLKCKQVQYIPVILHNLRNFDAHILCQSVGLFKENKLRCIAQNSERYVSFSLGDLRLIDSLQFLPSSLESLVNDLAQEGEHAFPHFQSEFPDQTQASLLLRKGVYPYEYMSDESKFGETSLPEKKEFYSSLKREHITDEDYTHAQRVFRTLELQNLGQYHDIYLKCDVLLLCDVFESFRKTCMRYYQIDSAHYYTSPGFSFAACLKKTGASLELITNIDIVLFLEASSRGGISQISHRFKRANNKLLESYDSSKPTSYIQYLDVTNLYGAAMVDRLPYDSFRFLSKREVEHFNIRDAFNDDDVGYILEVSLKYPQELHDAHADYPLAPQRQNIPNERLSPYAQRLWKLLHGKTENDELPPRSDVKKLLLTLEDKDHYILHYKNLQLYLSLGLELTNIHRILQFHQEAWMKPYIDFNTEKRKKATSTFQKNLYKLFNVSVFGKTMENVRKHRNIELVHTNQRLVKLSAKPTYMSSRIFSEDLVAVELMRQSITLNKPIYSGMAILDLSKVIMYDFYYNQLKSKYGSKVQLLMTDTDSFLFHCETEDIYVDMAASLDLYDTSDYPVDHPLYSVKNKKVLGTMKDETQGIPISSFVGLRSKMYCYSCNNKEEKRAKGISKVAVKKDLRMQHYYDTLMKEKQCHSTNIAIRSHDHNLVCEKAVKISLSAFDDKRYLLNAFESLPYGHYKLS